MTQILATFKILPVIPTRSQIWEFMYHPILFLQMNLVLVNEVPCPKATFSILGFSIYQMITAYIMWKNVGEVEINGSKKSQTQAPGNCWVIEYQKSTIKAIITYAWLVIVVGWFCLSYCSLGIAGYHKVNKRHCKIAL